MRADVDDPTTLPAALEGCDVAYYLVHSLDHRDFVRRDAAAARAFGQSAARAGVRAWPDAKRLPLSTANGIVEAPLVRLREVRLGNIVLRDVEAVICPPGALSVPLLAMSFLVGTIWAPRTQGRTLEAIEAERYGTVTTVTGTVRTADERAVREAEQRRRAEADR